MRCVLLFSAEYRLQKEQQAVGQKQEGKCNAIEYFSALRPQWYHLVLRIFFYFQIQLLENEAPNEAVSFLVVP